MKKIFYMLTVAVAAFAFASCEEDKVPVAPLEIEEAMVVFEAGGGQGLVKLSESGITATSPQDWCTVSVSGNEVTVNVDVNEDLMGRNSRLSISKGTETIYVTVTQQGVNMAFDTSSLTFTSAGGSQDVAVDAPSGVTITATSDKTWATPTVNGHTVTVTVDNYLGITNQTAAVKIKAGDLERTVTVIQEAIKVTLNPATLTFSAAGGSQDITVDAPAGLTVTASSNQTWATTSVSGYTVTVTVENYTSTTANRPATITVDAGGLQKTVAVTQRAILSLNGYSISTTTTDTWLFNPVSADMCTTLLTAWNAAQTSINAAEGEDIDMGGIGLNLATNYPQPAISFALRPTGSTSYYVAGYQMTFTAVTGTSDEIGMSYVVPLGDGNYSTYKTAFLAPFVTPVASKSPYKMTADDLNDPTWIMFTSKADATFFFKVYLD